MKYYKYILVVLISILFLPLTGQAYEYVNSKNKSNVERYRTDIYHLREMYEEFIVEEEETEENNSCTTVGTIYKECSGVTVEGKGTYSLDEYVAGVIKGEFGATAANDQNRYELSKVNAIAARSVIMSGNACKGSVISSATYQVFNPIDKNNHYI